MIVVITMASPVFPDLETACTHPFPRGRLCAPPLFPPPSLPRAGFPHDLSSQACPGPLDLCLGPFSRALATVNPPPAHSGSPFPGLVRSPGLHIWRVEKLKPVPVARENQGIFFSGDSYLVLYNGLEEFSHLHMWIGR